MNERSLLEQKAALEAAYIERLGARVNLRKAGDGKVYETDQGNVILDCRFGPIKEPEKLDLDLCKRAGIRGARSLLGACLGRDSGRQRRHPSPQKRKVTEEGKWQRNWVINWRGKLFEY